MVFKKWKLTAVLLSAGMMLAMCGCEKKVISVSSVSEEEGQETEYIEMQEIELKKKKKKNRREWDVGKAVCRVGEQCKVGDELVFGSDLQIVSGFCQSIVHGILLHVPEGGIFVGL